MTVPISWTGRKFGASLLKERCEVMLVMDWAESGRRASTYPRAVALIVLGIGERIIHSYREAGNIRGGSFAPSTTAATVSRSSSRPAKERL